MEENESPSQPHLHGVISKTGQQNDFLCSRPRSLKILLIKCFVKVQWAKFVIAKIYYEYETVYEYEIVYI